MPLAKPLDEHMLDFDHETVNMGNYLYVYVRPTQRATFWLLMLRNVFLPDRDLTIERPNDRQSAIIQGEQFAVRFNCECKVVETLIIPDSDTPRANRPLPPIEVKSHELVLAVIHDHEKRYQPTIRNERAKTDYAYGTSYRDYTAAQKEANAVANFIMYRPKNAVNGSGTPETAKVGSQAD